MVDVLQQHAGSNRRLAVDKIEIPGFRALTQNGVDVISGQVLTEHARAVKNDNELKAMQCAITACEAAIEEMRAVMQPGISENEMWPAHHGGWRYAGIRHRSCRHLWLLL